MVVNFCYLMNDPLPLSIHLPFVSSILFFLRGSPKCSLPLWEGIQLIRQGELVGERERKWGEQNKETALSLQLICFILIPMCVNLFSIFSNHLLQGPNCQVGIYF